MSLESTSDRARSCFSEMHIRKFRKATNFVAEHKRNFLYCIRKPPPVQAAPEGALQLHQTTPSPTRFMIQGSVSLKETPKYFQDLRPQFCLLALKKGAPLGVYFSNGFPISDFFTMNMFVRVFHDAPDPRIGKSLLWFWQQALRCECPAVQGSYHSCITQWK